jgi:hypothetical protein
MVNALLLARLGLLSAAMLAQVATKFLAQALALLISRLAYCPRFIEHVRLIGYSTLRDIPADLSVMLESCTVQGQDAGSLGTVSDSFGLRIIGQNTRLSFSAGSAGGGRTTGRWPHDGEKT